MALRKYNWPEIDGMLGKITDREVADRFKIPRKLIANRRYKLGIPFFGKWVEHEHLLGIFSDCKLAEMLGITRNAVTQKRLRCNIPACRKTTEETKLERDFVKSLNTDWKCQVVTSLGIIDILTNDTIYECKHRLSTGNAQKAVGQLLTFSISYPDKKLAIVCRKSVLNSLWSQVFETYGIEVIEMSARP